MAPTKAFPEDFSEEDKTRLTTAFENKTREIFGAYERLRNFLQDEYLPVAREGVGLSYMKGGDVYYKYLIESTTTLPLEADYIHNLGVSEVSRIKGEMEAIKDEVGFEGHAVRIFRTSSHRSEIPSRKP